MKQYLERLKTLLCVPRRLRCFGLALVYVGALLLIASYAFGLTNANGLLVFCLLLIVAGIVLHVLTLKRESRY